MGSEQRIWGKIDQLKRTKRDAPEFQALLEAAENEFRSLSRPLQIALRMEMAMRKHMNGQLR